MSSRIVIILSLLTGLSLAGCSWLPIRKADLSPPCQGNNCEKIAQSGAPWLAKASKTTGQYIALSNISLRVPTDFQIEVQKNAHLLRWTNNSVLRIKHITIKNWPFPALPNPFYQSHFHVMDYPRLMFLHRASEPAPKSLPDQYIWRMAMDNKGTYLHNSRHFYYSYREPLRLYFAAVHLVQLQYLVFVTDQNNPNQLVELLFYQTPFDHFLNIVASIKPVSVKPHPY